MLEVYGTFDVRKSKIKKECFKMVSAFILQLKQYKNYFDRPFFINHSACSCVMPEILFQASFHL